MSRARGAAVVICPACQRPYDGDGAVCPFDGTALPVEARAASYEGRTLGGRHRIGELIGRGGMGAVFRATDPDGRAVAVKILPASLETKPDVIERFGREARAVAALDDPRIIRIFSHGVEPDGTRFIVMELLDGQELSARLASAPMSLGEALRIAHEVAQGLRVAHASGVIHRDLKPSNVFLLGGGEAPRIKLLDFGVAKILGEGAEVTQVGVMVGTPAYMSPEQARGGNVDARADVYGLGALLYRLLSGRIPFSGESAAVVLAKVLTESVPPLRRIRPGLPRSVELLVARAMSRKAEDRFANIEEMALAIEACIAGATEAELGAFENDPGASPVDPETMDERPSSKAVVRLAEQRLLTLVWAEDADEATFAPMQAALLKAGSVAEHVIGDRGFGLFGAAVSEGDEPLRAVRAAMDGHGAKMRVGIATGRGRAGVGEELSGSVVDAAHRLAERAVAGEVLCDDETFRRIRGRFDVDPVGDGQYRVRGERPHGFVIGVSTSLGVETPLVGREVELAQIRAVFHRVEEESTTQAVILVGGPGMGKSRVKYEMRIYLENLPYDVVYLEGRGDPTKKAAPFHLCADAVRLRGEILSGDPSEVNRAKLLQLVLHALEGDAAVEVAHLIGAAIGIDFPDSRVIALVRPDPRLFRERIIDAFVAYFRGLGVCAPVALVLEDLQRADEGTLAVVDRLLDAGDGAKLFLLLVAQPSLFEDRPDFLAGADAVRVELRPLSRRSGQSLLGALLPGAVPEEVSGAILARAGGIPFFIEEVCAELRERGVLVQTEGTWVLRQDASVALPQSIEAVLQARLDHLPMEEKDLLMRASVLGEAFWDRAVEHLGASRVATLLPRLRAREFVSPRPASTYTGSREYIFRNALLREVAYGLVADEARVALHRATAAWLEAQGERDAAVLARHLDLGGDLERAALSYLEAARRAAAEQAFGAALGHATRALELASTDQMRLEARLVRQEGYAFRDERQAEAEELSELEAMAERAPPDLRAEIALRRGSKERFAGNVALAKDAIEEAHDRFSALGREADVARALLALAELSNASATHEETERLATEAREIAARVGRRDLEGRAVAFQGTVRVSLCDFQGGRDRLAEGLAIAREIGDRFAQARTLVNVGWVLNQLGAWAEAERQLEAARSPAQLLGKRLAIGYLEHNLGLARLMLGRGEEALACEERAMRIGSEAQDNRLVAGALRYLAVVHRSAGRLELADKAALDSIARARAIGHEELQAEALAVRSGLLLDRGDVAAALADSERGLEIRNRRQGLDEHEVELLVHHSRALDAAGRSPEAQRVRKSARALVEARAALVRDDDLRSSYLAIAFHRELLSE
ncbi:MAG: protein kinase [Deltaproteobacteria bacterium]|nr:protein kinase [Deltaproteobacteria bacterium]